MPPEDPAVDPSIAVEVRELSKSFGGVAALDGVDLELRVGEVHALLGENGAGKTTLSNILAGLYRADRGTVLVDGREQTFSSPGQAIAAGIGMVHQHFRLVYPMTVAENLHLGSPDTPAVLSGKQLVERARAMIEEFGLVVDPTARVWQLSVGEQQRVEILRVLARGAKVLILDEPTAVLTAHEATELFAVVRRLVAAGRTVVFISHKLNEVLNVSDRITVLRGGRHVITREASGITPRELARLMTGEETELVVEHREVTGATVLELAGVSVRNDRGTTALDGVDLTVRAGEVLGIAGVSGNGQTELAEVITGLRPCESGRVVIAGTDVTHGSPREIAGMGVGHIPEDRIGVGMVPSSSVAVNAILRHYRSPELSTGQVLRRDRIEQFAEKMVADARVQTRSVDMPAAQMSGGNQQRLVARRESMISSTLLVAAHPTRGLDVLASKEVQSTIVERRDAGCGVLMISDDLDEVLLMSDRVAVMYEGRVLGVFDRAHIDREVIGLLMAGHTADDAAGGTGGELMIGGVRFERRVDTDSRRAALMRLVGAAVALLLCGLLLLLTGRSPLTILGDSIDAVFGSKRGMEGVALQSIPILMCALAVSLSMRMKVWNIGSDGQFLMGAFVALGIGTNIDAPGWILLVLMALGSLLGGSLWIVVPAIARAYWGVNEIITTLLLNFVALQLVLWASLGFWRNEASSVTQSTVPITTMLPVLPGLDSLTIAFLVPIILTFVLWAVFRSTRAGFEIDIVGGNARAASFAGIAVPRRIVVVMLITGAIAGLGGMLQLAGAPGAQALSGGFSARYGLSGFIVAALAGSSFIGVLVAGLFVSAMFYAGIALQTKGLSVYIIFAIYGAILIGIAIGEMAARFRLVRVEAAQLHEATA